GIALFDPKTKQIKRTYPESGLDRDNNLSLFSQSYRPDSILINYTNGLYFLDPIKWEMKPWITFQNPKSKIYGSVIHPDGTVYMICWSGIYRWQVGDDLTITDEDAIPGLLGKLGQDILIDKFGKVWVSTSNDGVFMIDGDSVRQFLQDVPNYKVGVYCIEDDKHGNIWVGASGGIAKIDGTTFDIQTMTWKQGVPIKAANQFSSAKTSEYIIFGGTAGYMAFHPDSIQFIQESPKAVLERIQINYEDVVYGDQQITGSLIHPEQVTLFPSDRVITFHFTAPNLLNPEEIQLEFKLEGFNEEWVQTAPGQRNATFTSLQPGDYRFFIRTCRPNGPATVTELVGAMTVIPPIHQTWWFRILLVASLISLSGFSVYWYNRKRFQREIEALKTQQKIQLERQRISRDLHDNVGSQLTGIVYKLNSLHYQAEKNPASNKIIRNLDVLDKQVRGIMQMLRDTIWAVNQQSINVQELYRKTQEHLHQQIGPDGRLEYEVHLKGNPEQRLSAQQTLHIFRIIQEAVQNTLKYAEASLIQIHFEAHEAIHIQISDNGIGMNLEDQSQRLGHYGLENMQSRAADLNAQFDIQSQIGQGTQIRLSIQAEE
ncbi:MAG: histidine kinase, partial [Bacteroidota bacterium]